MPRARSSSMVSVWVVPLSTLPTVLMTPVSKRMRSVRLVLPASTCARIPILTIAMRHTLVEDSSGHCVLQRLPHGTLLLRCAHCEVVGPLRNDIYQAHVRPACILAACLAAALTTKRHI